MTTMLDRKHAVTGHRGRSSVPLIEQKKLLDEATRKTAGIASRTYEKVLREEMSKLLTPRPQPDRDR